MGQIYHPTLTHVLPIKVKIICINWELHFLNWSLQFNWKCDEISDELNRYSTYEQILSLGYMLDRFYFCLTLGPTVFQNVQTLLTRGFHTRNTLKAENFHRYIQIFSSYQTFLFVYQRALPLGTNAVTFSPGRESSEVISLAWTNQSAL